MKGGNVTEYKKRGRASRPATVIVVVALLAAWNMRIPAVATATAEPPRTAVTSAGQALAIDITSPATPVRVPAPGTAHLEGTALVGTAQSTPLHAGFVVDLSGSTAGSASYDCNGNGITDAGDDFNGSGGGYGQLVDCSIAGVLAITDGLVRRGNTEVAIVGFAQRAAVADMQAAEGDQHFTPAANDSALPAPGDVETVARSLQTNQGSASIDRYTRRAELGSAGAQSVALSRLVETMRSRPEGEERVAFFLSDDSPLDDNTLPLSELADAHVKVNTFALGLGAHCEPDGSLARIAAATGGRCTAVASPAALTTMIQQAAAIAAVEYSLDGAPFAPVTSYDPGTGAFELVVPVTPGDHRVRVRARAADGTVVQSSLDLTGIAAPVVLPGVFAVGEGTALPIPGDVSDADSGENLSFAWAPDDGRLAPVNTEDTVFRADDDGTFDYDLTATDLDGLTGTARKTIEVVNVSPRIRAVTVPEVVDEGHAAVFAVDYADPGTGDSHVVRFSWGDGTADTVIEVASGPELRRVETSHTYAPGTVDPLLVVTVTDDDGGAHADQRVLHINHGPSATLDATAYSVTEGGSVTVAASFADVDGDALTASLWVGGLQVGAGGPSADPAPIEAVVGTPWTADQGEVEVRAVATDTSGLEGSHRALVRVLNAAPVMDSLITPAEALPDEPVTIDGSFHDAGVHDAHTVDVDWGDGVLRPGSASSHDGVGTFAASHTYARYGTYRGLVRVCDADGGCTERLFTVAVGTPPTAMAGDDVTVTEGSVVTLTGRAIDADADADGQPLTYRWTGSEDGMLTGADTLTPTFHAVDEGVFTYELVVCDSQGACGSDSLTITVQNAPPAGLSLVTREDRAAGLLHLQAAWSDPGTADAFELRVEWADGSTPQTVGVPAGTTEVDLTHAYGAPGTYAVAVRVSDDGGGAVDGTVQATVRRNAPPDADAGGPYTVAEGSSLVLQGEVSDVDGDAVSVAWNDAAAFSAGRFTSTPTFAAADGSAAGTAYHVSMIATDALGASTTSAAVVTVTNVAPEVTAISGPSAPVQVGTASSIRVDFDDPSPSDTFDVVLSWADGTTSTVPAGAGVRSVTATHTYTTPGVHTVTATVTDSDGAPSDVAVFEYVVVYDPSGGFVTGAGSIVSPLGAYLDDPSATGKATFGIASKYAKGSTVPSGETGFQFKAGGMEFKSTANEYLVISGSKATYRGVGMVNGVPGHGFQVIVYDGTKGAPDRFRIKIWNDNQGNVVYDNERGSLDEEGVSTTISTGSIVIHRA